MKGKLPVELVVSLLFLAIVFAVVSYYAFKAPGLVGRLFGQAYDFIFHSMGKPFLGVISGALEHSRAMLHGFAWGGIIGAIARPLAQWFGKRLLGLTGRALVGAVARGVLKGFGIGAVVGMGLDLALYAVGIPQALNSFFGQLLPTQAWGMTLNWGSAVSGAATGAATGAAVGSIVPGIGTAIGAGVGALVGFLTGLFLG